jgi:tRNA A-37 threonylcarbamoyl transferase component Bud32
MGNQGSREVVVKIGDVIEGRYRIIRALGEGGMGAVFLAEHALIKRRVAIKILHPELATDATVIERFMNEARAAGTLGHPNIVESTDMGFTQDHVPYIVFEYLEGTLLTDEIYRVGGLPVRRVVRIAQQIASALHAAHNAGIVHRDLKSDNVFLTDKDDELDRVKVLDFGISRFLETADDDHVVMGTPEFMAPEQIVSPATVDRRADVYALGVIIYEMLAARRPFNHEGDQRMLLHRIVRELPPPLDRPEVPHALAEMIHERLLAKDPAQRYPSMVEVEMALDAFTTQGDIPRLRRSRPIAVIDDTSPAARMTPWPEGDTFDTFPAVAKSVSLPTPRRHTPWLLYGIAAAGVLVGGIGLFVGTRSDDRPIVEAPRPMATMPAPKLEARKVGVHFDADAPNARVTFRRRVAQAPSSVEIPPSDIVELVEVSAPGYKTTRFWLTFDRPTHLRAHLAKGDGLAEATEEQTLVALGELDAPAPAIAAKPVTVAPAAARSAPRKIGKISAPVAPLDAGTHEVIEAAPAEPVEPPPVEPPPVVAIEAAPEVKPAEPMPDPVKPAEPIRPPEPVKPAIAVATVASVVGSHRPEVFKCFAEGRKKDKNLKGTLTLQLAVEASGRVKQVQIQTNLTNPLVAGCVVKAARAWRFPARPAGDIANVSYPFTLN